MSSLKVNNNLLSFLKIFFERANKVSNTVASFGNVFKNSKWSDLKTQNIKKSFNKQWFLLFIWCTIPLLIVLYFKWLPFFQLLILPHLVKQFVCETFYDIYSLCLYSLISLPFSIQKYSLSRQVMWSNPNTTTPYLPRQDSTSPNFLFHGGASPQSKLDTRSFVALKAHKALNYASGNLHPITEISGLGAAATLVNTSPTFGIEYKNTYTLPNCQYTLSSKLDSRFTQGNVVVSGGGQNVGNIGITNPTVIESLTRQLLRTVKQYRWLTKNNLNTPQLNQNSNSITESKLLIAGTLESGLVTKQNVWLSNNMSSLTTDFLRSVPGTQLSELRPYNFFEYSRFFSNMRFFHLINFSNLLPQKTADPLTLGLRPTTSQYPNPLNYMVSTGNLDLGWNTRILNPEVCLAGTTTGPTLHSNHPEYLLLLSPNDFLLGATLEAIDTLNTTSLRRSTTWPTNANLGTIYDFRI